MTYPIPHAALDDRLAFVGTSGSGKTYAAGTAVEKLLHAKQRVVIFDPLGVWHGLRLEPDGKPGGFPVVIMGGTFGDLPLHERSATLIGKTIATARESIIIDLSEMSSKAAERRTMLGILTALYHSATGEPVHLVFDEADEWAPQTVYDKDGEAMKLKGRMSDIVRRGRVKGFIPWLITQRPAVIAKDVLSQAEGLIALKLTSSQDRAALDAWVSGQADERDAKGIKATLPTLERGTAWVWIPGRGVMAQGTFPQKATFDSSRQLKRGEKRGGLAIRPLDIEALRSQLVHVEAEAKENDPATLKAEIARLKKAMSISSTSSEAAKVDTDALQKAAWGDGRKTGYGEGFLVGRIDGTANGLHIAADKLLQLSSDLRVLAKAEDRNAEDHAREQSESGQPPVTLGTVFQPERQPAPPSRAKRTPAGPAAPAGTLSSAASKMLDARRAHRNIAVTWDELCVLSGLIPGNGYFYGGKKELVTGGYLTDTCDLLKEGEAGQQTTVGGVAALWTPKLKQPAGIMLAYLLTRRPAAVDQADLAAATNLKPGNGYWYGGLKALRKTGLIQDGNPVALTAILTDGRLAP